MERWPHVVIIGGGFGGLNAAQALARAPVRVTLIDRRNYHLFQPLLYQVATAALNPSDIAYPIRSVLAHQRNARVLLAEARSIDVATRTVVLDGGELHYDYLILAVGATHSYFGKDSGRTSRRASSPSRMRSRSAAGSSSRTRRPSASQIRRSRTST